MAPGQGWGHKSREAKLWPGVEVIEEDREGTDQGNWDIGEYGWKVDRVHWFRNVGIYKY